MYTISTTILHHTDSSGAGCHTGLAHGVHWQLPFRYASMWSQSFALHERFINKSTRKFTLDVSHIKNAVRKLHPRLDPRHEYFSDVLIKSPGLELRHTGSPSHPGRL